MFAIETDLVGEKRMTINYGEYQAKGAEKRKFLCRGFLLTSAIAWLFYRSFLQYFYLHQVHVFF